MNSLKKIVEQMHAFAERMSNGYAIIEYELLSEWISPIEAMMKRGAVGWIDTLDMELLELGMDVPPTNIYADKRQDTSPLFAAPHDREEHVPGIAHCNKCDFTLTVNSLNMDDGTVTAGNAGGICPNGCGDMRPVTWKEWAQEGWARAEQVFNDCKKMRSEQKVFPETSAPGWFDSLESFATNTAAPQDCDELRRDAIAAKETNGVLSVDNASLRAELEAEKAEAAAMRDKLLQLRDVLKNTYKLSPEGREELAKIDRALSSEAGREYVPMEKLAKCENDFRDLTTYSHRLQIELSDSEAEHAERLRKAEEGLERAEETIDGLTPGGCIPPTWLEAETLRKGMEELRDRTSDPEFSEQLQQILDDVLASESLPASSELARMREELEQYKRDAERYRWLRARDVDTIHKGGVFAGVTPDNLVINEEDLDAHIDRAMLNAVQETKQG